MAARTPFVIKDAVKWGTAEEWLCLLSKRFGEREIAVSIAEIGADTFDRVAPDGVIELAAQQTTLMKDFVKHLKTGARGLGTRYLAEGGTDLVGSLLIESNSWHPRPACGWKGLGQPFWVEPDDAGETESLLWLSDGRAVAATHCDPYHNFNVCIAGTKHFW